MQNTTWQFKLHFGILISIIILPFLPLAWLRKGLFLVPFLITLQWVFLDGCIITKIDPSTQTKNFTQTVMEKIGVKLNRLQASEMGTLFYVSIMTIIIYRFSTNVCNCNCS